MTATAAGTPLPDWLDALHRPEPPACVQSGVPAQIADGMLLAGVVGSTAYGLAFDATDTALPDEPDRAVVQDWLHRVRAEHYVPEVTT